MFRSETSKPFAHCPPTGRLGNCAVSSATEHSTIGSLLLFTTVTWNVSRLPAVT